MAISLSDAPVLTQIVVCFSFSYAQLWTLIQRLSAKSGSTSRQGSLSKGTSDSQRQVGGLSLHMNPILTSLATKPYPRPKNKVVAQMFTANPASVCEMIFASFLGGRAGLQTLFACAGVSCWISSFFSLIATQSLYCFLPAFLSFGLSVHKSWSAESTITR